MNSKIKRPISIWITQILLIIFTLLFLFAALINSVSLFNNANAFSFNIFGIVVYFIIALSLILLFIISFWGLAKKKNYGRWLGVTSLALVWVFAIIGQLFRPKGPIEYYEYENNTQLISAYMTQGVLITLFLALILYVAFSKRVTAFFQPQIENE